MEEYLQCINTLRSQMNDVEEQAATISVKEQTNITTIESLQKDLDLAKEETQKLKEETSEMMKTKGQTCAQILEKQRKIASLESDSSTLTQSLELIIEERGSLSAKLELKSMYYIKVAEDIFRQLKEQQDWINSYKHGLTGQGNTKLDAKKPCETKDSHNEKVKKLMENLNTVKDNFQKLTQQKSKLASEYSKVKECFELVNGKLNGFKVELREMDEKSLKDEVEALVSDKAGEIQYTQSLQPQILKLKQISSVVKCSCGEEFKVELVS